MIEELLVQVDNLQVSCLRRAAKEQRELTVVFIHGFPFSKEMWRPQLKALPANVEGIAYDIRGFGGSAAGHTFYSIDLFAKDLWKLVRELGLGKVVLCGISMGGYIALRAAELQGGDIAGLILADTNASADTEAAKLKRFESIEQIQAGGKERFAEGFLKNVFSEESFATMPDAVALIRKIILSTSDSTLCSAQLALASRTSTIEFLPQILSPVLILRGQRDTLMSQQHVLDLRENIPNSEFAEIREAAHLSNLENPRAFNLHLKNFLHEHFLS